MDKVWDPQEEERLFIRYGENWRLIQKQRASRDPAGKPKIAFAELINQRFEVPVYPISHYAEPNISRYHITDKDKKAMAARLAKLRA